MADVMATRLSDHTLDILAAVQHNSSRALLECWGAHLNDQVTSGLWSSEDVGTSVSVCLMVAMDNVSHGYSSTPPLPDWDRFLLHPLPEQHHLNLRLFQLYGWILSPGN